MEDLLTGNELAKYLKLNPTTVLRKSTKGEIPAIRIGREFRYDRAQIAKWLTQRTVGRIIHILVIDDEPIIGQLFEATLQSSGYQVTVSGNINEALGLVNGIKFDLIFLDLLMPELNGAELFKKIRQINKQVPVAIITGYPDSELMSHAMEHGPFIVLKNPFTGEQIIDAVGLSIGGDTG